ncbi:hypothetical protein NUSPORA_01781 [Nucleospora cyclopteri]
MDNEFSEESNLSFNLSSLQNSDILQESTINESAVNESDKISLINKVSEKNDELLQKLIQFLNKEWVKKIRKMCARNGESIEFPFDALSDFEEELEENPEEFLGKMSEALKRVTKQYFPSYYLIRPEIHARITDLPVMEELRALRNCHLNKLIRVTGVVTRRSAVHSLCLETIYTCGACKASFGPFKGEIVRPQKCFECQKGGPFSVNTAETTYRDYQRVTMQEIPNKVPPGSLPRAKEIILYDDLVDSCKPGDEVDVTGIYKNSFSLSLNVKSGFPVFATEIECSSLRKREEKDEMTEEDVKAIKALGRDEGVIDKLINSIAPSIFGHKEVKTAVLLSMVGGAAKEREGMKIRGDINILLMGDPGTAKSQFLRFVHKASHRGVLATGQGASGVGLTAAVRRDPNLKEWTLEGGALVLADRGICCIDEFDKMNENDRVSIHEAMEQQSISISKAGIVASLHARCAVVAAANPIRGIYNPALNFSQNINLSDPIVSRFDILCVVRDIIEEKEDRKMADFILQNHIGRHLCENNLNKLETIEMHLFKKYILYARNNFSPTISEIDNRKISQLYIDLRRESMHSGIPITVRHIESIVRISEAFAKLRLSNYVAKQDIERAIKVTLYSFLSAQKYSVSKQLKKKFAKYFDESNEDLLMYLLKKMITEKIQATGIEKVRVGDFKSRCKQNDVRITDGFFEGGIFVDEGFKIVNGVIMNKHEN